MYDGSVMFRIIDGYGNGNFFPVSFLERINKRSVLAFSVQNRYCVLCELFWYGIITINKRVMA